jgi:hypothetical protein
VSEGDEVVEVVSAALLEGVAAGDETWFGPVGVAMTCAVGKWSLGKLGAVPASDIDPGPCSQGAESVEDRGAVVAVDVADQDPGAELTQGGP